MAITNILLVGVILLVNLNSFFWLDLIYALAIGVGLPELVINTIVR